jgi:hypothetical protein
VPPQTARRTHARPAHARTAAGRAAAPRHHRRVSGPARPAHALRGVGGVPAGALAGGRALPRTRTSTSAFERLGRLPDHRVVDGLLRSRGWIVVIGVLLGGIVAMQVSLLKLNSGISRAVEASATLERQNADMQANIARLSSGQRVSANAAKENMVFPPAGEVRYLRARPGRDAALATRRMTSPSAAAQAVMAAGGHGSATAPATATTPPTATTASTATTAAPTPLAPTTTAPTTTAPTTTAPTSTAPTSTAPSTTATTSSAPTAPTTTTTPSTTSSAATAAATSAASGQG